MFTRSCSGPVCPQPLDLSRAVFVDPVVPRTGSPTRCGTYEGAVFVNPVVSRTGLPTALGLTKTCKNNFLELSPSLTVTITTANSFSFSFSFFFSSSSCFSPPHLQCARARAHCKEGAGALSGGGVLCAGKRRGAYGVGVSGGFWVGGGGGPFWAYSAGVWPYGWLAWGFSVGCSHGRWHSLCVC